MSSSTMEGLWVMALRLNSLLILAETKVSLNFGCFQDLQMLEKKFP